MRVLALLHRWTGAITGLLLALIGLSGALLVWRDQLTLVPHARDPVHADAAALAHVVAEAAGRSGRVDRITFAGDGLGVHQVIFTDGSGAYLSQAGEPVARWTSEWQRPELWLFDLHHHLLLGREGETVTGIAGLIGLFFIVSGVVLWWRVRSRFRPRPWPAKLAPGAIVHHHRDLGVVTAPLLLLSMLTGVLMVFPSASRLAFGEDTRPRPPKLATDRRHPHRADYILLFRQASARFPGAEPRRLQLPRRPGDPLVLRLRQSFEWTPNGRTFLYFDPATMTVLGTADPSAADLRGSIREKLYPVHAGKAGGLLWKLATTLSGVALALLGSLAVYGFWLSRWNIRAAARRKRRRR